MRYLTLVLTFGLMVNTGFAQPVTPETYQAPEQSIPIVIKNFVSALNRGRNFNMPQLYIFQARQGYYGAVDWFKSWQHQQGAGKFELINTNVDKIDGLNATATVTYKIKSSFAPVNPEKPEIDNVKEEIVKLRLNESRTWQIVAPNEKPEIWEKKAEPNYWTNRINFINEAAFELAQRDWKYSPADNAKLSADRLKALTLAVLQFRQDYNEVFAFAPQHMQDALSPYMVDKKPLFNPITGEAYGLNNYLCGALSTTIKQPEWTVMFYEGQDQKPIFRYDGKALISFIDGRVKFITPAEADDLIWKF